MEQNMNEIKKNIIVAKALRDDILDYDNYDIHAAYLKSRKRIRAYERKKIWIVYSRKIAAILLIPLLLSTGILSYLYIEQLNSEKEVTYLELFSAPGIITQTELPDKSKVWLNAGSKLRYPSQFVGNERNVYLSGEGYFEVKADKEHPFFVSVDGGLKIKAHGTKFNVNAYNDDTSVETTLETGLVDVQVKSQAVPLKPNELACFDKINKRMVIKSINVDEKTSWKDGRLVFRNTPLEEVVKQLSRRYNVDIVLHKQSDIDYKCRASFSGESITQVLDYLKLVTPIRWKMTGSRQLQDHSYSRQRIDIWLK